MSINDRYFKLCYTERIHEFAKIDEYKKWAVGTARTKYKSLDEFYQTELEISQEELNHLRTDFKRFNDLYSSYFNEQRKELFDKPEVLLEWYDKHKESCNYCFFKFINQSKACCRIIRFYPIFITLNFTTIWFRYLLKYFIIRNIF